MELPRVNPTGVLEVPEGYVRSPRAHSRVRRWLVAGLLAAFVGTTVVTTAYSLAVYCLTTWAGAPASPIPGF